jgi:hypothetical protein
MERTRAILLGERLPVELTVGLPAAGRADLLERYRAAVSRLAAAEQAGPGPAR